MKKIKSLLVLLTIAIFSFTTISAAYLTQEDSFYNIVIFIRFADETSYQAPYDLEYYDDLFNATDQASLKDYYLEVTYDQLTINSYLVAENTEIIWYTDTHERSYYEPYDEETNPNGATDDQQADREHSLLANAVKFVDNNNYVPDDLNIDVNNDGEIDSLTFMISGEDNGWNSLLWPHKWELYSYVNNSNEFTYDAPEINGVNAYTYTFELLGNSTSYDNKVDVGVLAHETFHLLSAPDLYHYYEYPYITPVGEWDIMDSVGAIPSHMLGYMKYRYGNWIENVSTITESGSYTLYPMQDSPDNLYRIPTNNPDEYIYLEYRDLDGLYESTLPDSGLLVYRVNSSLEGNENGSYDEDGNPTDEIWVFRPGMSDTVAPIVLEDDGYVDGDTSQAIISDNNLSTGAGPGQDIMLWQSNGDIINITISNVIEHDGYVTFDVILPPSITLNTSVDLPTQNVTLFDDPSTFYSVSINNVSTDYDVYYTTDGSTPTNSSTKYDGTPVEITGTNNEVKVSLYNGETRVATIAKEFTFSKNIESAHSPYGDMVNNYWYIQFKNATNFSFSFDNRSSLEEDYDYLYVTTDTNNYTYTGTSFNSETSLHSEYILINLKTDEYVSDTFGFIMDLDISLEFLINGQSNQTIEYGDEYLEEGATYNGVENYTIETIGTVDITTIGEYTITYNLIDEANNIVSTLTKTVTVEDNEAPVVNLLGDSNITLEFGEEWIDPGVTYSDNYDTDLTYEVINQIDGSKVGTFYIKYKVTDSSGNSTTARRQVTIEDTTSPEIILNPSVDTIEVDSEWIDEGVTVSDLSIGNNKYKVTNNIDLSTPGTYEVVYTITDNYNNTSTISRFVTIVESTNHKIICDPFNSNLEQGKSITVGDCYFDGEKMTISHDINKNISGVYEISYTYELDDREFIIHQYVYVYSENIAIAALIDERREF